MSQSSRIPQFAAGRQLAAVVRQLNFGDPKAVDTFEHERIVI